MSYGSGNPWSELDTSMYYVASFAGFSWNVGRGGASQDSGKPVSSFEQTNVVVNCHGTGKTWWAGTTSSWILWGGRKYYTAQHSVHSLLACGG